MSEFQPQPRTAMSEKDEAMWAMFCHLAAFSQFVVPLGSIIGPLVVWLIKRDESEYIDYHGKESLNFQISMLIYLTVGAIITVPLMMILVGFLLLPALIGLFIFGLVVTVIAAVRANEGERYRYPLSIRFIT